MRTIQITQDELIKLVVLATLAETLQKNSEFIQAQITAIAQDQKNTWSALSQKYKFDEKDVFQIDKQKCQLIKIDDHK